MVDLTHLTIVKVVPRETDRFLKYFGKNIAVLSGAQSPGCINPTQEEWVQIKANNAFNNIYLIPNKLDGKGRSDVNVTQATAIFADDDIPRKEPRTDWPLSPSLIVKTSTVETGNKYHYYWLTNTTDLELWRRVQKGLIATFSTDKAICNPSSLMRLPGFLNKKNGSKCELIDEGGQVYEWDYILEKFPPIEEAVSNELSGKEADGTYNEIELIRRFQNPQEAGWITESGNSIIMHMAMHGYSEKKISYKIEQLISSLDEEILKVHAVRYMSFRKQIDKFIRSAKKTANTKQAINLQNKVTPIKPQIPDALDWDWSILQSNPIPEEAIPATMLEAAKEIGEWTATGQDPAILSAVFITSALLSKNIMIHEIGDNLTTHCQSGICIVMDTGARKSSIYNQMNQPFFDFENRIREEWNTERFTNESMAKALDMQISKLDKAYEKSTSSSPSETLAYANNRGALLLQKDKIQLKQPWLRSADVTEQKLVRKLNDNQGCMAVISDDARQVINNLVGKYNKEGDTGESVYINALTGSTIMYERVGSDEEICIQQPVLNALLFVQPDAALKLRNSEMFVPSGLAARLPMYFYPVSGVDIVKKTQRRYINKDRMSPYYTALQNICIRRIDNPLHVRLDEAAMAACARMDVKFAKLLETSWRGHYDKSNKLITLTIMYATCFASLEDPQFAMSFRDTQIQDNSYNLPVKYLNMGFMFSQSLFGQSITSHKMIAYESLPRKAESFLATLQKWYAEDKVREGIVHCAALSQQISTSLREFLPEILDLLVRKGWLFITIMEDEKRKLNNGFPDKFVSTGDLIYHLNVEGIKQREELGLDTIEKGMLLK